MLIILSLLGLLTYLLKESRVSDLSLRTQVHEALQTFELHDAELSRDVLLARAGRLPNFDPLIQTAHRLQHDLGALRLLVQSASDAEAKKTFDRCIDSLTRELQSKLTLVEYFKSDNALLRNSLMYLTFKPLKRRNEVVNELGRLSSAILSFLQTSEASAGVEIQGILKRLTVLAPADGEVQRLISHSRFVVQILPQVDKSLRDIIASSTVKRAQELREAIFHYVDQVESRAQVFRTLLYFVSVLLLAYLAYQYLRVRSIARQLAAANVDLRNETRERKETEQALRTSEERLRAVANSAKDAIVTADRADKVVFWNAGAERMFGYSAERMLGQSCAPLFCSTGKNGKTVSIFAERFHAATPQSDGRLEVEGLRADGSTFPLEVSLARWAAQGKTFVTAIIRDVSERKELEAITRQQELQLIQADKMMTLGTLVSGVAHEINNPNQLVLLNSRILTEAWHDILGMLDEHYSDSDNLFVAGLPYQELRDSVPTLVRDIHSGAQRIERIVHDLKDFARPQGLGSASAFQLNEVIERTLRLLGHLITKRTEHFRVALAKDLPCIHGSPQQLEQVIANLVINALEALPDRDAAVSVTTYVEQVSGSIVLEVRDEGSGIKPEHLARLCDPFFTTKQATGGTGLGLAITSSLVRAHGGTLEFSSATGEGTCALVKLRPAVESTEAIPGTLTATSGG